MGMQVRTIYTNAHRLACQLLERFQDQQPTMEASGSSGYSEPQGSNLGLTIYSKPHKVGNRIKAK